MDAHGQAPFAKVARAASDRVHWYGPATIGLFLLQAFWMRLSLGRWPVVYRDVATGPVGISLEALTGWAFTGLFFGYPVLILLLFASWEFRGPKRAAFQALVLVVTVAILVTAYIVNPVGFPEWWID